MNKKRENSRFFLAWLKLFTQRNLVLISFLFLLIIGFSYYLFLNSRPFTNNAFLVANIRPVSTFVPGYITKIFVSNNQKVKKGDKILQIFNEPYKLEVDKLENNIDVLKSDLVGIKNQIDKNEHLIKKYEAAEKNALYLSNQATKLAKSGVVSEKNAEQRQQELYEAKYQTKAIKANYETSKANYSGTEAKIKSLINQLNNAKINLKETTIIARTDGIVTNLFVGIGTYLSTGEPICSFVESDKWWVQANFKETSLSGVKIGDDVKICMWIYPNKVFHGKVESLNWNVNRQSSATKNYLQEVEKENEWFLLPQRLPVMIALTDEDSEEFPFHAGASAGVTIEAKNPVITQLFWLFKNN